jgi:hypothetical protein
MHVEAQTTLSEVLYMILELKPSLRLRECAQAHEGHQRRH